MLVLAALFVCVLVWNELNVNTIHLQGPKPLGTENLQLKLDSLGKNYYNTEAYNSLKSNIGASQMANVISEDEMNILLASLEDKATLAMILSFDQWMSNDCGEISNKIITLISLMKKKDALMGSPEVNKRLRIYSSFQSFLALQGRVSNFLRGEYTESSANALESSINSASNQEGVNSCSMMSSKKSDWLSQIQAFKKIYIAFTVLKDETGSVADETCDAFKPYSFYYNQLLTLGKCQ